MSDKEVMKTPLNDRWMKEKGYSSYTELILTFEDTVKQLEQLTKQRDEAVEHIEYLVENWPNPFIKKEVLAFLNKLDKTGGDDE